jgi:predicted  nucleic acid-binding Zn ribbon protein
MKTSAPSKPSTLNRGYPKPYRLTGRKPFDPDADNCPACNASWVGASIPEKDREHFGGATRFRRIIGVEVLGEYDGISAWECPDCKAQWNRWTGEKIP